MPDEPVNPEPKPKRHLHRIAWGADIEHDRPGARYGIVLVLLLVTFIFMASGFTGPWVPLVTVTLQGATLLAALAASEASQRLVPDRSHRRRTRAGQWRRLAAHRHVDIAGLDVDPEPAPRGRGAGLDRVSPVPEAQGRRAHRARSDLHLRLHRDVLRLPVHRHRRAGHRAVLRPDDERHDRRLPLLQLRDPDDRRLRRPHGCQWHRAAGRQSSTHSWVRSTSSPCWHCSSPSLGRARGVATPKTDVVRNITDFARAACDHAAMPGSSRTQPIRHVQSTFAEQHAPRRQLRAPPRADPR